MALINDKAYNRSVRDDTTFTIIDEDVPTGKINITANGTGIDVAQYATADVAVPQPAGKIDIVANGTGIDVADYATADVAVPTNATITITNTAGAVITVSGNLALDGTTLTVTGNGTITIATE